MKKVPLVLLFFFTVIIAYSQDLIILKNGNKIYCKIIKEDSLSVVYKKTNLPEETIKKQDIEKYFFSKNPSRLKAKQENTGNELFVFSAFGGFANAIDEFGSKDLSKETSGLAQDGGCFYTSLILKVSENFGFSTSYIFQKHKFDDKVIVDYLNTYYQTNSFSGKSKPWIIKGFFAGIHLKFPLRKIDNLSLNFDLNCGLPKYELPELITTGSPFGYKTTVTQKTSVIKTVTFLGGIGLKYGINKRASINIGANYLYGKPGFSNIHTSSSNGFAGYSNYTQKVTTINVQAGLSLIIYSKNKSKHNS